MRFRLPSIAVLALGLAASLGGGQAGAADPVPGAEVALDAFFHCAVIGLDGTKVKLKYDFSNAEQKADWVEGVPWRIAKDTADGIEVAQGRLAVRGSVGARHIAEWEGDLLVTCRMIPDGTKDIGAYLGSEEAPDDYVTFSIGETYFHNWDNKAGGETGMMKFGKQYVVGSGKAGFVGFRYLASRMPTADTVPGKTSLFAFGRKGPSVLLTVDDLKLDSHEPPKLLPSLEPGFYAIKSSVAVDDVVLEGTISPKWLAAHKVGLRTIRPIVSGAEVAAAVDPAVQALVDAYKKPGESPAKLVDLLKDSTRPEADRQAAIGALKSGPRKAVNAVIDLLYSTEVKVRALGIDIVKALLGKSYGYEPKAGEKSRGDAVKRLNKDLQDHPELTQGSGG